MNILTRLFARLKSRAQASVSPQDAPAIPTRQYGSEQNIRSISNAEVVTIERAVAEFRELRKPKACRPAPSFADACEELRLEQELQAEIRADGNKVPRTAIARKRALHALKSC